MAKNIISVKEIDVENIMKRINRVDESGQKIEAIVNSIVEKYCGELDNFIQNIYTIISNKEVDVPDVDVEYMALQLPCLMYFTSDFLENLGIREDISRGIEKEVYNKALLEFDGKVSEKESVAQMASQEDALITSINARAYRKIKARIEYALETLGSLKKVLANRISNKELSKRS